MDAVNRLCYLITWSFLLVHIMHVNGERKIAEALSESHGYPGSLAKSFTRACSQVKDLAYANCFNLRETRHCKKHKEKMEYYCPLTCHLCNGPKKILAPPPPKNKCLSTKFKCCKDNHTVALGPNLQGCPERCFDTANYGCGFYKKSGFCESDSAYYKIMLERCPLTCNFCKKTSDRPEHGCFDKWNVKHCQNFRRYDLCSSLQWSIRLKKYCRKTCKRCTHNAPLLLSIASECSKNNTCCWDKSVRKRDGRCPVCKDSMVRRFCRSFKPDCLVTRQIKGVQIRILCSQTCGLCDYNRCKDDTVYGEFCRQWKKRGNCQKYPTIMLTYCKKTCGFC